MADRSFDPLHFFERDDTPTLGTLLELERVRRGWGRRQLALAAAMPYEKYQRVKADVDLPTGDELQALCDVLDRSAVQIERHLRASVGRIVEQTLALFSRPRQTVRAARRRGPDVGDADRAHVEDLPLALRRAMATDFGVAPDDVAGLAAGLRRVAAQEAPAQAMFVRCMAATLELEGEGAAIDAFEALMGDDDASA